MNNPRLFLWVALALILFVNYQTWMKDYGSQPVAAQPAVAGQGAATDLDAAAPQAAPAVTGGTQAVGTVPSATAAAAPTTAAAATPAATAATADTAGSITVHTDVLDLSIDLRGGELDRADILQYP